MNVDRLDRLALTVSNIARRLRAAAIKIIEGQDLNLIEIASYQDAERAASYQDAG